MAVIPQSFYHIYNRGNNRDPIFYSRNNYLFFLKKVKTHLLPHVSLVAYCLMPNHFHLMIQTLPNIEQVKFSNDLKIMLRSYTRAINKQENRTGSLFQQNTKIKSLEVDAQDYPLTCFHYIHQNPLKARLVSKMEDWEMSSFRDYLTTNSETLCSKHLAYSLLDVPESPNIFLEQSNKIQIIKQVMP